MGFLNPAAWLFGGLLQNLTQWCAQGRQVFVTVDADRGLKHCLFNLLPRTGVVH